MSHNSHPHGLCLKVCNFLSNNHNEQEKHVTYHDISKTIHIHIGGSGNQIFLKKFIYFFQNLVLNA